MSIENLQSHYGFTTMPFGRDIAPQALHRHPGHREAIARIHWCITQRQMGVITGEVGAGKTVAVRAALAGLEASRHQVIYWAAVEISDSGCVGVTHAATDTCWYPLWTSFGRRYPNAEWRRRLL